MTKPTPTQIAAQAELEAAYAEAESCGVHVVRYRFPQPDKVGQLMVVASEGRLGELCSSILDQAARRLTREWNGGEFDLG